jgi:PAS domain S-box-containing protein
MRNAEGDIVQWYGVCLDIDAQMHAEEALRQSERSLQQLVDALPVHIWSWTPAGKLAYVNKRSLEDLGLSKANFEDNTSVAQELVHPEDVPEVLRISGRCLETGEAFLMRYRRRWKDGNYRWLEGRCEPLRDRDGTILHWYQVSIDIDDQVRADEALQNTTRQLQQMIDAVPINIMSFDPSGKITSVSKRYVEQVGSLPAHIEDIEALARHLAHPEDLPATLRRALDGFATGMPFVNRFRRRDKDGVYSWIEARAQPLRDASGAIMQWYVISVDIDSEVRTQEELRKRERFVWQLVETLPAMIDCASPSGEPIYRSQRLRQFLGYELEALDGTGKTRLNGTLDAGVHPDDIAGVKERYAHCLATGDPYARRHRLRRFDGEYRWVETRAEAMRNAEGDIVQWNVICLDIESEVRAEEGLRLAQEKLARASQAASLAELSASIAHEVNQPLAAVVANSHACQRWLTAEPPNIERAHRTVERIIRDANAAADVVSRVRALFKQSADSRVPVMLGSIVSEARELLAEEARRRSVRIDVNVENDLPSVAADRVQLQQVLVNLIRNGMEAMDILASDRILRIRVRRDLEAIRIEVSDNGSGFDSPDRIFEPFFTTKEHGMGMGLAICRSIIESHGGKLWAEKNDRPGAAFIFTLPVEVKEVA